MQIFPFRSLELGTLPLDSADQVASQAEIALQDVGARSFRTVTGTLISADHAPGNSGLDPRLDMLIVVSVLIPRVLSRVYLQDFASRV